MYVEVGKCPKCGAPMYSPSVWHGVIPPPVYRTCNCFGGNLEVKYAVNSGESY